LLDRSAPRRRVEGNHKEWKVIKDFTDSELLDCLKLVYQVPTVGVVGDESVLEVSQVIDVVVCPCELEGHGKYAVNYMAGGVQLVSDHPLNGGNRLGGRFVIDNDLAHG
jgi:hypothetical protein